ncbi:MBL fold metallo-hydrolase [Paraglaciecola chathamensis]|uniref:Arylsulfatase n=2 Tax=Paraglaciecola chathamensis TaxID=368405 RepID=A0A8H9I910_9ALTE|nr:MULTISPECIES: MBL fold metallo-hydrolase [Paraglaciecola]GAC06058.1 beta-lactamase-like protein [Paraglaciecola agarilytica NO2]GGZ58841.1 arylsulfatase [Paraglaciecola oceanifecundans]
MPIINTETRFISLKSLVSHAATMLLLTTGFSAHSAPTQSCAQQAVTLQVLGSGGPELNDDRVSSSYLIWHKNKARILIDAGPGSSVNFGASGADFTDVQAVLLTHLHVDHSADLPAYIKGSYFTQRSENLTVYGPSANALMPNTSDYLTHLMGDEGAFAYLSDYTDDSSQADYHIKAQNIPLTPIKRHREKLSEDITITAIPVHHGPVAAVAWRVDIGSCGITFSGDMSNKNNVLATLAKDSDILVMHNAVPQSATGAAINLHMRPLDIGKIAQQANAKRVVLSHFMNRTRNDTQATLKFVQQHYSGKVEIATDMARF